MKKILLIICCLLMCACQNNKKSPTINEMPQKKENIVMKEWHSIMMGGDGNENGYYHFMRHEIEGNFITNLCYFDYATKKEVYLCDKAQCQHTDNTCTSFLEGVGMTSGIFVYKDHVYIVEEGRGFSINTLGEFQETPARLFQMDLDGKNRRVLSQLEKDYEFESGTILVADDTLYIPITKNDKVEYEKNSYLQMTVESDLYAIDLTNGNQNKLYSMKNKNIVGAERRNIVLEKINYKNDPEQFIAKKDYQGYDKAILDYTINYIQFSIDTCEEIKEIQAPDYDMEGVYYQNKLYWLNDGVFIALDLDSGEEKRLYESPQLKDLSIDCVTNGYAILSQWGEDEQDGHEQIYVLSLDNFQLKENTLCLSTTLWPIDILGETKDDFLVNYDHDAKIEKSWAGTYQYSITNKKYALIKKADYFQNKGNYEKIKLLDVERED